MINLTTLKVSTITASKFRKIESKTVYKYLERVFNQEIPKTTKRNNEVIKFQLVVNDKSSHLKKSKMFTFKYIRWPILMMIA